MGFFARKKSKATLAPPPESSPPPPVPSKTRPSQTQPPLPSPPAYQTSQTSGVTNSIPSNRLAYDLPPPPSRGRNGGPAPAPSPPAYHQSQQQILQQHQHQHQQQQPSGQQAPIVINQNYYVFAPMPPGGNVPQGMDMNTFALKQGYIGSTVALANPVMPSVACAPMDLNLPLGAGAASQWLGQGSEVMNQICERFNDVMTLIDREKYRGNESNLFLCHPQEGSQSTLNAAGLDSIPENPKKKSQSTKKDHGHAKGQTTCAVAGGVGLNYFSKVELYANSRLPMNLPPLKLYIPTWPLLCLAAQYSERVYEKARGKERDVHVDADFRAGTKAMVIKSVPIAHMNTIVFAIRGTASFMDWAVNLKTDSTSPVGFLDDYGNYCHAGFLSVARRMVKPVAARLRQLLQENPGFRSYSLLITGHSAGGAVASLLYAHMLSSSPAAQSELSSLTAHFKRVHCVTFGTPPVSLLPLQKPSSEQRPELKKSLFLSFVNEGDPVARADKAYVRSLLELFATPAPGLAARAAASAIADRAMSSSSTALTTLPDSARQLRKKISKNMLTATGKPAKTGQVDVDGRTTKPTNITSSSSSSTGKPAPVWNVPPAVLSNAGRIVVLRSGNPKARFKGKKTVEERLDEGVVAQIATDEQLRSVIWGDPVCHLMKLYAGRLEMLAVNSVTVKNH